MDPLTEDYYDISDAEKEAAADEDDNEEATSLLRDRFRVSTISIAQSEDDDDGFVFGYTAKENGMEISQPVMVCIADLAFKYAEQLADDLELFAHHANRKTVNMKDVILSAHRNKHLADELRSFSYDLKTKEPQSEKRRKKSSNKEDKALPSAIHIDP